MKNDSKTNNTNGRKQSYQAKLIQTNLSSTKKRKDKDENYVIVQDADMSGSSQSQNDSQEFGRGSKFSRSRSRSGQSTLSARANTLNKSKKRKFNEISNSFNFKEDQKYDLWIKKYQPQQVSDLAIQKKKVAEFTSIISNPEVKILILTGQPGCAKNTLLDVYCQENKIKLLRFIDQKQNHISDVFERKTLTGSNENYPDDLENLIAFLNTHIKAQSQGSKVVHTKTSSFCKNQSKAQQKQPQAEVFLNKMLVINGLPECLKIYSERRLQLLRDFNYILEFLVQTKEKTPIIVFTFSDPNERSNSFLNRIFSHQVMQSKGTALQILNINPPTESSIDKILKLIIEVEQIQGISDEQLKDLRTQCNKDLRNAIQTLQLYCAGKRISDKQKTSLTSKKLKKSKIIDEDDMDAENFLSQKQNSQEVAKDERQGMNNEKDNPFTIFHALGKFLYNKRINPQNGNIEQMTSDMMKDPVKRPKLYFKHNDMLNQVQIEKPIFALYLHENMLNFFNDINDIANCLDSFSYTDSIQTQLTYSYGNQQFLYEMDELGALIDSIAITEYNIHGGDQSNKKHHIFQMSKPYYYQQTSQLKQNKQLLRETAKDCQILQNKFISEDLLIRSHKEIQKNILPYLSLMNYQSLNEATPLAQFNTYQRRQQFQPVKQSEILKEDDARDNVNLDQKMEEQQMIKQKQRKKALLKQQNKNKNNMMQIDSKSMFVRQNSNEADNSCDIDLNESDLDMLLEDLSIEDQISEDSGNDEFVKQMLQQRYY